MSSAAHILVVDDELNMRRVLQALLEQAGYLTSGAGGGEEALGLVRGHDPDLVLSDLKMPGMDGLELLRRLREQFPEIPVVLLTAHGTVEAAVEAMKRGAHDFLTKPFERTKVLEVIGNALAQAERSRREFQGPLATKERCGIVGRSAAVEALRRLVERVAPTSASVLVTGETGTGKELVAEALHRLSPRAAGPVVRINCGALPDNLVEAELFGYERGAFSGAEHPKPGRFELADRGTLFLDEIGDLPLPAQVKLLRVLQDGAIDRLGGTQPRRVDVRLVAATNRDLDVAVAEGEFRPDLLFRLRVVEIKVPPLRERLEDIPLLVDFFLDKHVRRLGRPLPLVSEDTMAALTACTWPGNVRELENTVERALLLAQGSTLTPGDFGLAADEAPRSASGGIKGASRAVASSAQRRLIRAALEATHGNVTRAAERLGLSRRGLQLKMKEFGFRSAPLS